MELSAQEVFTWQQGEGDGVDAVLLGGTGALAVGDVHLELDRLLEDRWTGCGLVFCTETGLRDDAVAQTGDLGENRTETQQGEGQRTGWTWDI